MTSRSQGVRQIKLHALLVGEVPSSNVVKEGTVRLVSPSWSAFSPGSQAQGSNGMPAGMDTFSR